MGGGRLKAKRRWLIYAAVAVAVGVAIAMIAGRRHWPEARLAREIERRLGVPVAIGDVGLGEGMLAVRLGRLRVGPARSPLLAIDSVEISAASIGDVLAGRIDRIRASGVTWRPANAGEAVPTWTAAAGGSEAEAGSEGLPQVVVEQARLALDAVPGVTGHLTLSKLSLAPAGAGAMKLTADGHLSLAAPTGLDADLTVVAEVDLRRELVRSVDVGGRLALSGGGEASALRLRLGELRSGEADSLVGREGGGSAIVRAVDGTIVGLAWSLPEFVVAAGRATSPLLSLAASATMAPGAGMWASLQAVEGDASGLRVARLATRMAARAAAVPLDLEASASLAFSRPSSTLAMGIEALTLAVAADSTDRLRLRGRGAMQADLAAGTVSARIVGTLDDSPATLGVGYRASSSPPFSVVGELQRFDLGRIVALPYGRDGKAQRAAGADLLPNWPLSVDLRIALLESEGVIVEDARLRYRPDTQSRAE